MPKRPARQRAEALVAADDARLTRFANSEIHQNVAESDAEINLRFVVGRRVGVASSNRVDDEGLRRLAERGGDRPELRRARGLRRPAGADADPGDRRVVCEATASATPNSGPRRRSVIAAADAVGVISRTFSTANEVIAVANSKGIRASQRRTTSQLLTVAMAPDGGSGYSESAAVDVPRSIAAIGREAADKAPSTANPVSVDPGNSPVVLEELAVVDLLDARLHGLQRPAVQEKLAWLPKTGRGVRSGFVADLVDDGMDPATLPMAFDSEAVAEQRVLALRRE